MKNARNKVPAANQNTEDIEGYYFSGKEGSQVAFWEAHAERESKKHSNPFDEYMICLGGQYTVYCNDREFILNPGDELLIPKDTVQWGKCIAGTRTIHFFGGKRIQD